MHKELSTIRNEQGTQTLKMVDSSTDLHRSTGTRMCQQQVIIFVRYMYNCTSSNKWSENAFIHLKVQKMMMLHQRASYCKVAVVTLLSQFLGCNHYSIEAQVTR